MWHCGHASHPDVTCKNVHTEILYHKPCQCHHMLHRSTCMMCAHHKTMFLPFSLRHTTSSKCASSLTAHACVIHTSLTRCCDIPCARARPAGSQVSNPTATHLNPCANKDRRIRPTQKNPSPIRSNLRFKLFQMWTAPRDAHDHAGLGWPSGLQASVPRTHLCA